MNAINPANKTVNDIRYLEPLPPKKNIVLSLSQRGINPQEIWFQPSGATPHTTSLVLNRLHHTLTENVSHLDSPNLGHLCFFLWRHLSRIEKFYSERN